MLAGRVAGCIKLIIPDKVRKLSNIMSGLISTNNIFNIIIIVLLLLYVLIVLSDNRLQKLLDNIKIRIVQIIYCVMAGGFGIYAIVRVISDNINKIGVQDEVTYGVILSMAIRIIHLYIKYSDWVRERLERI